MMCGGLLSGIGLIGASFCHTVSQLYFCIGVIGGESFSALTDICASFYVNYYSVNMWCFFNSCLCL